MGDDDIKTPSTDDTNTALTDDADSQSDDVEE